MSRFTSLSFIYPYQPPKVSIQKLRAFCNDLQNSRICVPKKRSYVEIEFGDSIDQDYQSTNLIDWDESDSYGVTKKYPWDHTIHGADLEALWPDSSRNNDLVYRAAISIGSLTSDAAGELGINIKDEYKVFAPDTLSLGKR
jgi:hypothetical protein